MKLTIFDSVTQAYIDTVVEGDWTTISTVLTTHLPAATKDQVKLFNLTEFKTLAGGAEPGRKKIYKDGVPTGEYKTIPGTVRRCKENIVALHGLVLDFDGALDMIGAIEKYQGIEMAVYTTWNHTPEKHRFRMVLPFVQPLLAEDIAGRLDSIKSTFPEVDQASFSGSQSFYFHCGQIDNQAYRVAGTMIDPYNFEYAEPPVYPETTDTVGEVSPYYKQELTKSLLSCSGLHYTNVLTLITICRSVGMTFDEFNTICMAIMASDSTLKSLDLRRSAWQDWDGNKITRVKRDKFIAEHNGTPVAATVSITSTPAQRAEQQLMELFAKLKKKREKQ